MKFLISNYSNPWNTESYYFNAGLNLIDGVKSEIFNSNDSVYDNFDKIKPDIFITHASQISKDVIYYLKDNQIQIIINCNGITKEAIENISQNSSILTPAEANVSICLFKYFLVCFG